MTDETARYGVYFVPEAESSLHRFGSTIIGYDCYAGRDVDPPDGLNVDAASWGSLTEQPRRYGFHATLKAPFRLAPECTEAQLVDALVEFAALDFDPVGFEPDLRILGGFAAIVPREPSPALECLASACTMEFDRFRAAMSAEERSHRLEMDLSPRQNANLERWGYPYVFADFRFHMTLTGKIPVQRRDEVLAVLRPLFARMCNEPVIELGRLTLVKQEHEQARFVVLRQAELRSRKERTAVEPC